MIDYETIVKMGLSDTLTDEELELAGIPKNKRAKLQQRDRLKLLEIILNKLEVFERKYKHE